MAISVECDNCFFVYPNVPESARGKAFKCKQCGSPVRVPRAGEAIAPASLADKAALPPTTGGSRRPQSKKQGKAAKQASKSNTVVIGSLLGVVVLAGGLFFLLKGSGEPAELDQAAYRREIQELSDAELRERMAIVGGRIEELPPGSPEHLDERLKLKLLVQEQGSFSRQKASKDPAADVAAVLADSQVPNSIDAERMAFASAMDAEPRAKFMVPIVEAMTAGEFQSFRDAQRFSIGGPSFLGGDVNGSLPIGWKLGEDDIVKKRQELWSEYWSQDRTLKSLAAALKRLPIEEYRGVERAFVEPRLEAFQKSLPVTMTVLSGRPPESIGFDANGLTFADVDLSEVDKAFAHATSLAEARIKPPATIISNGTSIPNLTTMSDEDVLVERDKLAEQLESSPTGHFAVPIVAGLTAQEFRDHSTLFNNAFDQLEMRFAMSMIPLGHDLSDDGFLEEKRATFVARMKRRPHLTAVARVLEEMGLEEYRKLEYRFAEQTLELVRADYSRPTFRLAKLAPADIRLDETGFRFPADVEEKIFAGRRKAFESLRKSVNR